MKKNTTEDKVLSYMEALVEWYDDLIDKHELNAYLIKGKVDTNKVESSKEITAEQVAILGGYLVAHRAFDAIERIQKGESVSKPATKKTTAEVVGMAFNPSTGEVEEVRMGELPPEVLDAMKKFISEQEKRNGEE